MPAFSGRQTQFYVDVVYGAAFSLGFGYLLFFGMDARVAALQGGLVLGYLLRVWENMRVYERILEEAVAAEAEEAVAAEAEEAVAAEAEEAVAAEVETTVDEEVQDRIDEEVQERVDERVQERVDEEVQERVENA